MIYPVSKQRVRAGLWRQAQCNLSCRKDNYGSWRVFQFHHQIPEAEQKDITPCPKCFCGLMLKNSKPFGLTLDFVSDIWLWMEHGTTCKITRKLNFQYLFYFVSHVTTCNIFLRKYLYTSFLKNCFLLLRVLTCDEICIIYLLRVMLWVVTWHIFCWRVYFHICSGHSVVKWLGAP